MLDGNSAALRREEDRVALIEKREIEIENMIDCRMAEVIDEIVELVREIDYMYENADARDRVLEHLENTI